MRTILSVARYVPWTHWKSGPVAREAVVRLTRGNARPEGVYSIVTPWACFPATPETSEDALVRALPNSYATKEEALEAANRKAPHFHRQANQAINSRLDDAIRWQGGFMGPGALADCLGVSTDTLYLLARGVDKATRIQAAAAERYHGQRA